MAGAASAMVSECNPREAWDALSEDPAAVLVDVRTRPEWSFVGTPDLSELGRQVVLSEWRMFPDMGVNATFADDLMNILGGALPARIYFLCRSGARSMEAAKAVAHTCGSLGQTTMCVNIAEGFEGDLDTARHRGALNGWKARGLPWQQS